MPVHCPLKPPYIAHYRLHVPFSTSRRYFNGPRSSLTASPSPFNALSCIFPIVPRCTLAPPRRLLRFDSHPLIAICYIMLPLCLFLLPINRLLTPPRRFLAYTHLFLAPQMYLCVQNVWAKITEKQGVVYFNYV